MTITSTNRAVRTNEDETLSQNGSNLLNLEKSTESTTPSGRVNNARIVASDVELHGTYNLFGTRPIVASNLQVSNMINSAGVRPIATSDLQVSDTINLLGIRPIAVSEINVSKTLTTSGVRPIAANTSEKVDYLMGYLD